MGEMIKNYFKKALHAGDNSLPMEIIVDCIFISSLFLLLEEYCVHKNQFSKKVSKTWTVSFLLYIAESMQVATNLFASCHRLYYYQADARMS